MDFWVRVTLYISPVFFEVSPPNETERQRKAGSRRSGYRRVRMTFLVRGKRNPSGEAAMEIDFVQHCPVEGRVVEIRIIRRLRPQYNRDGALRMIPRWHVVLVTKKEVAASEGANIVGVALDWKGDGHGGAHLCVVADKKGVRKLTVAADHLEAWASLRGEKEKLIEIEPRTPEEEAEKARELLTVYR
jgi:hypothetical protein